MSPLISQLLKRLGLTEDIGIVVLSRRLLVFTRSHPKRVIEIDLTFQPPLPPPPAAHLPQEVKEALTTRLHLGKSLVPEPIFIHDEIMNFDAAETAMRKAIESVTSPRLRFVKPRVVIATASNRSMTRKRALLDAAERAGARQVFLTNLALPTAMGAGLDILHGDVYGILLVEKDWSVFAVVTYADEITYRFIPFGALDIPEPRQHSDWRNAFLDTVASALAELRPNQINRLEDGGIHCAGFAAHDSWLEAIRHTTGLKTHPVQTTIHPAAAGLKHWLLNLDDWKAAM